MIKWDVTSHPIPRVVAPIGFRLPMFTYGLHARRQIGRSPRTKTEGTNPPMVYSHPRLHALIGFARTTSSPASLPERISSQLSARTVFLPSQAARKSIFRTIPACSALRSLALGDTRPQLRRFQGTRCQAVCSDLGCTSLKPHAVFFLAIFLIICTTLEPQLTATSPFSRYPSLW